MRIRPSRNERPLHWVGSSKRDLLEFPESVVDNFGYALGVVQYGGVPPSSKPLKGLGPGVLEIVQNDAAGSFRVVYTVRFRKAIYVLHAFHKKSPSGIRTARQDIDLIEQRLKAARLDYKARYGEEASE
jgi:phage-related protein